MALAPSVVVTRQLPGWFFMTEQTGRGLYRHHQSYDALLVTPADTQHYQLRVSDVLAFADRLREEGVDPGTFIYDTAAFHPQPILGLRAMWETTTPVGGSDD